MRTSGRSSRLLDPFTRTRSERIAFDQLPTLRTPENRIAWCDCRRAPTKPVLAPNDQAEKPTRNARVTKAEQVSKNRWHLDVKVSNIEEIDGELLGWLRQAYDLCG